MLDPGEPGGGASEGGGGAAGPVAGTQPGGERLRGGGRPKNQRGEEVPLPSGPTEEETRQPHGLPRDSPVQQRRGGRDRKSIFWTGKDGEQELLPVVIEMSKTETRTVTEKKTWTRNQNYKC